MIPRAPRGWLGVLDRGAGSLAIPVHAQKDSDRFRQSLPVQRQRTDHLALGGDPVTPGQRTQPLFEQLSGLRIAHRQA